MENYKVNVKLDAESGDLEQHSVLVEDGGTFTASTAGTAGADGSQLAILCFDAGEGEGASGQITGVAKCRASGAVTRFADVMPAAGGKISAAAGAGNVVFGRALEAAGADGDIILVALRQPGDYTVLT